MNARGAGTTAALIVAAVALIFAIAGTAIAGPGSISSKISKAKVKKIAKKQINKAAPGLSVAKAVKADSADTAASADSVNGHQIFKIFAKIPVGSADQTIATFAGYTLSASCTAAGDLDRLLLVPPDTPFTNQTSTGNGNVGPVFSYGGGSAIRMDSDGTNNNTRGAASFSAARSDGIVLTGVIGFDNDPAFEQGSGCAVYGEVTQAG
jgi:hypothetical protein